MNNIVVFGFSEDKSERIISVNVDELSRLQSKILFKYEDKYNIDMTTSGCTPKDFIKRLDHYILHTIEEVIEARQENNSLLPSTLSNHTPSRKLLKEEMVDIVLYLGTIRAILKHNLFTMRRELNYGSFAAQDIKYIRKHPFKPNYKPETFDKVVAEVVDGLIRLRMLFPERKWHKPYNEASLETLFGRILKGINEIDYCICAVVGQLYKLSNEAEINEIMANKHQFVVDLEKVKGEE